MGSTTSREAAEFFIFQKTIKNLLAEGSKRVTSLPVLGRPKQVGPQDPYINRHIL